MTQLITPPAVLRDPFVDQPEIRESGDPVYHITLEFSDIEEVRPLIKQIEKLVNEFSDFARMPKPIFRQNNLVDIINDNINLLKEMDNSININFKKNYDQIFLQSDKEQISRVFLNLIKNSIESINQKSQNNSNFNKKIAIELNEFDSHINISIEDNGIGFSELKNNIKDILNPYFTTKKNGSGLGLSIVNKIVNDHNGKIDFMPIKNGAKINIIFIK